MTAQTVRLLLIDDSEDDALLTRAMLGKSRSVTFNIDWAATFEAGLDKLAGPPYEVCLVDYRLGSRDGLDWMRAARAAGCRAPMIMLTGLGDVGTDLEAIRTGAADYLIKGKHDADLLERVIRHSIERQRAKDELEQRVVERTAELSEAVAALRREIAQRKEAEGRLRETEERYHLIFEQALDSIVLVDAVTGAIVDFNEQACKRLGYSREEFSSLRIGDIEAQESDSDVARHLEHVLAQGADVFETRHRTRNGTIRNVIASARPITLRGRSLVISIWHDITERKQMEDELREAIVHLEQHDKAKSEFVTNVSHELKTPLTSMLYGIRNLLKGVAGLLPAEATRSLLMFDTECQRLVRTISDILDLGKLDNHALTLSPVTVPLARLLSRGVETMRAQADAAGLTLKTDLDRKAGFVKCDPAMMQRVLQNILGNAIKFTPAGGSVVVQAGAVSEDGRFISIAVDDTGVGIPAAALTRVTERYFRVGDHAVGSGLGLALSREIVELHGGTMEIASPPPNRDRGTRVTVTLPVAQPPVVLVVDDDPAILALAGTQLAGYGYAVERTSAGLAAMQRVKSGGVDAIVLDLVLRDIHGCDVILALKGNAEFRHIPVIAITGATLDDTRLDVLTRFSVPALPKPWQAAELIETLDGALVGITAFETMKRMPEVSL